MAAMKPRTGDGPLEVTKEGRGIVMRVPLQGGGRLVVELTPDEAGDLGDALRGGARLMPVLITSTAPAAPHGAVCRAPDVHPSGALPRARRGTDG